MAPASQTHKDFLTLAGRWTLHRILRSSLPSNPSGVFTGHATFEPRRPSDPAFEAEHLYTEHGTLTTENGLVMQGTRRYVYRYRRDTNRISVWFVTEDGESVDYLFHEVGRGTPGKWGPEAEHQCRADLYRSSYLFEKEAFGIRHVVKGPAKDYVAETRYRVAEP